MRGFAVRAVPNIVVFLSGLAIMVLELVASKLVAKHIGMSLETWTTVIGVILAGMSLGNYFGGRLSDLREPIKSLPYLMGGSALLCLSVLATNDLFGGSSLIAELPYAVRIVLTIALVFFPPACVLGTIQPTVARWAVQLSTKSGSAFGNLGAWGTIGNILGTFLTGYVLLSKFGVRSIVLASVAVLGATAVVIFLVTRAVRSGDETEARTSNWRIVEDKPQPLGPWLDRAMPNFFVFSSGLSIMMIELVGGRLISRAAGTSIYTWTSLIGVILAGVSLGNYIGGFLADRFDPAKLLPHLFLVASALAAILLKSQELLALHDKGTLLGDMELPTRIFVCVFAVFFAPACALGTISPAAAKLALERANRAGVALGNVYAWGAIGSIAGTFLTGFVLISLLGTKVVLCVVAGLLALISVCMATSGLFHAIWAGIMMAVAIALVAPDSPRFEWASRMGQLIKIRDQIPEGEYLVESNYYAIKVYPEETDRYDGSVSRTLVLDNLIHGYVVENNPRKLKYDYELIYSSVIERAGAVPAPANLSMEDETPNAGKSLSTLFLGGGSYTYQRYIGACYPHSSVLVAEIDPAVTRANHKALYLPDEATRTRWGEKQTVPTESTLETRWGDARHTIDQLLKHEKPQFDFIFGDAFNDFSVPWHLTTLEFNQKIKQMLAPGGVYMINIIDNFKYSGFLGAYVQTARKTFGGVAVFCTAEGGTPSDNRETFVIAMSAQPLDLADLGSRAAERRFEGTMLTDEQIEEAIRRSRFDDPWYRRRYLTKEQEAEVTDEETKTWELKRQRLNDELDRLTREAKSSKQEDQHHIAEAQRRLREHSATRRRQIENAMREHAKRPDVLAREQLARMEADLRALPELILTDDFAPVENLLAPVARDR